MIISALSEEYRGGPLPEAEICEQIYLTVIRDLAHYFGLDENQLTDA
jgi:predicted Zn-dependent protease with MMP-like domain